MDTTSAQSGATLLAREWAPAHRCKPRRNRTVSGATLALALGLATVGGTALGAPAAQAATTTVVDSWQSAPGYGWPWGGSQTETGGLQSGTATLDASDASAAAEVGLVEITSSLSDGTAAGTGMVLSSDGTVVTNHHVVEGANDIQVTVVSTGRTAAAGDSVTAVGDANGDGGSLTAAPGTVLDTDQSITVQGEDGSPHQLQGLIEVNADVIPGDSGGALLSSDGTVVGMNVAASSGTSDIRGYVIPISTVLSTVRTIESGDSGGSVQLGYSAYLGVGLYDDTTATIAGALDGSAAADAGLQQGDTITSVDGQQIDSASQLRSVIAAHQAGDTVRLTWTTADGEQRSATVTLGQAPVA